jgi:hypothetical protein
VYEHLHPAFSPQHLKTISTTHPNNENKITGSARNHDPSTLAGPSRWHDWSAAAEPVTETNPMIADSPNPLRENVILLYKDWTITNSNKTLNPETGKKTQVTIPNKKPRNSRENSISPRSNIKKTLVFPQCNPGNK